MINEANQETKPLAPLILRFHHLLCLPLFEGKGYSDSFSANMAMIKGRVESTEEEITFICDFDSVCENCPNKSEKGCLLNGNGGEKIEDKDINIAKLLGVRATSWNHFTYKPIWHTLTSLEASLLLVVS